MSELTYGDYRYPHSSTAVGFLLSLSSVAMIPLVAMYKIRYAEGTLQQVSRIEAFPVSASTDPNALLWVDL